MFHNFQHWPLLTFELFSQRRFLVATVSQLGSQFSIFALFFWLPLFLSNVWDWSPSGIGWVIAIPMVISLNSLPTGHYADRHGYRGVLVVGGLVGAASLIWFLVAIGERPSFAMTMLPGLLLFGWGLGMVGITVASAALAGLDAQALATANSAFQASRRVVQTLGIAVVVAVLGDQSADALSRYRIVWVICISGFVASSIVALFYPRDANPAD